MGKNRKQQRNSSEMSRRGNPAEGRMGSRRSSFYLMLAREQDRYSRDGVSSGHPPHGWTGPPSPYTHPRNSMQYAPGIHYPPAMQHPQTPSPGHGPGLPLYPPSEMNMRMMPANVPSSYFLRRNDTRGLRHRLFNEDYRYAGPQQVRSFPSSFILSFTVAVVMLVLDLLTKAISFAGLCPARCQRSLCRAPGV
ncbi:uncharacterized protein LDX57_011847 [Aspergillus melleus]|uniref:uncharacterized protein n=1 Tax=Aspergillus melleus TaxID=138277 RepID=UPI001E8E42E7|nr:uncharacterized protein LDX57_011847 [Aspergillus melleus]KAH8434208.1 hypothetical protein LDX57_011847 [Aspergillus melleus]